MDLKLGKGCPRQEKGEEIPSLGIGMLVGKQYLARVLLTEVESLKAARIFNLTK